MSTLYMCEEKHNPDSRWADYTASMPQEYSEFPRMFTVEDLEWLKGSPLLKRAEDINSVLEDDYDVIA